MPQRRPGASDVATATLPPRRREGRHGEKETEKPDPAVAAVDMRRTGQHQQSGPAPGLQANLIEQARHPRKEGKLREAQQRDLGDGDAHSPHQRRHHDGEGTVAILRSETEEQVPAVHRGEEPVEGLRKIQDRVLADAPIWAGADPQGAERYPQEPGDQAHTGVSRGGSATLRNAAVASGLAHGRIGSIRSTAIAEAHWSLMVVAARSWQGSRKVREAQQNFCSVHLTKQPRFRVSRRRLDPTMHF
jgi:hypothetical protein